MASSIAGPPAIAPDGMSPVANTAPPPTPAPANTASSFARAALDGYRPGILERLFGFGSGRPTLERALSEALAGEETAYREALADHEQRVIQARLWAAFAEAVEGTGASTN